MIGRLNHVAIAVRDLEAASRLYRETLGAVVSEAVAQPEQGVTTVFVSLPNTKIELIALRPDLVPPEIVARRQDAAFSLDGDGLYWVVTKHAAF